MSEGVDHKLIFTSERKRNSTISCSGNSEEDEDETKTEPFFKVKKSLMDRPTGANLSHAYFIFIYLFMYISVLSFCAVLWKPCACFNSCYINKVDWMFYR